MPANRVIVVLAGASGAEFAAVAAVEEPAGRRGVVLVRGGGNMVVRKLVTRENVIRKVVVRLAVGWRIVAPARGTSVAPAGLWGWEEATGAD